MIGDLLHCLGNMPGRKHPLKIIVRNNTAGFDGFLRGMLEMVPSLGVLRVGSCRED